MSEDTPPINDTAEVAETPQTMTYEEAIAKVNEIADNLGHPIDKQIKAPLVALWMNGINTTGSCEGHKDWGLPYPWVDIEADAPEGWEDDESLQASWKQANLDEYERIRALLGEFYADRPSDYPLVLAEMGIFGSHRLQPIGDHGSGYEHIDRSRQEMSAFADFLMARSGGAAPAV